MDIFLGLHGTGLTVNPQWVAFELDKIIAKKSKEESCKFRLAAGCVSTNSKNPNKENLSHLPVQKLPIKLCRGPVVLVISVR